MFPTAISADLIQQYLMAGDFLGFIQAMFTVTLGDIYFGGLMMIVLMPVYFRTHSWLYVSAVLAMFGTLLYAIFPAAGVPIVKTLMVIALGGSLYNLIFGD